MRTFLRVLFLASTGLLGLSSAPADPTADLSEATQVARAWVAQIDAGNYDESYVAGSSAMHEKIPQDRWTRILQVERKPMGKVVRREETKRTYRPNGLEGTDGEFVVFSYATAFENSPDEVEYVALRREDGVWKGAGYTLGPANADVSATPPDSGSTTTSSSTTPISVLKNQ